MSKQLYRRAPFSVVKGIPVFTDRKDRYIENYDRIAKDHLDYDGQNGESPFMLQAQIDDALEQTQRLLQRHVEPGSRILDAGLGLGELLAGLDGVEKFGVDISLEYLERAKEHGIEVALSNLEDLPYEDNVFDAIVTTDVLEHVLLLDTAAEELLRVLKPGGLLFVRVPNEENLTGYTAESQDYEFAHVRNFSLSGLKLYFEKSWGLEYSDHAYSGYVFGSANQLRIRSPRQEDAIRQHLQDMDSSLEEIQILKKLLGSNEEEVVDALISIRDNHPDLASQLIPLVVDPLDVTVVFRKPQAANTSKVWSGQVTQLPHQAFGSINSRPEEILLLCYYEPNGVPTVPETVSYMQKLSGFSVTVLNMWAHRKDSGYIKLKRGLNLNVFSAVVLHNSLSYNIDNLSSIDSELDTKLAEYEGVKVLMKQDENFRFLETAEFVLKNSFDLVFTCLPMEAIGQVYPGALEAGVQFHRMLTGYVTPSLRQLGELNLERVVDIGYRGSIQPLSFGQLAYEKREIGYNVARLLRKKDVSLDISSSWEDRLGGDSWLKFLASCRATLGCESGASIFDLDGDLEARCAQAESRLGEFNESERYASAYLAKLKELEGNVYYNQVSPRHFEAAATRTIQLLYPGAYSDIFVAGRHYFSLEKSGSNIAEAIDLIRDENRSKEMTDAAFEEVICNPENSIGQFVVDFDDLIGRLLDGKRRSLKPVSQTSKGHNVVLLAAHEPSVDPRLAWIEGHAQLPLRIHQLGVLPPEADSASVEISENASFSQAYPRQRYRPGFAQSLFPLVGASPSGMVGVSELCFLEHALTLSDVDFSTTFGAPLGHDRNHQFKWYLQYILDTSMTLIHQVQNWRGVHALIATDLDTLPAALILKAMFGVKVLYDAHEYWAESDTSSFEYETQFWIDLERRLVAQVDQRQTVSPGLAELMSQQYSVPFSVVPNCEPRIDRPAIVKSRPHKAEVRFLFQGNFAPNRGIELLIGAWPGTKPEAVLLLRGPDSEYKQSLVALARGTGLLGTRIKFPAAVPESELVAACADGDVGLIPYEPAGANYRNCCPNKMSQYMVARLPILANTTMFVGEVIASAECGEVVDFSRKPLLVSAVNRLSESPQLRAELGEKGGHYYREKFNWQVVSESMYQVLSTMVSGFEQQAIVSYKLDAKAYYISGSLEHRERDGGDGGERGVSGEAGGSETEALGSSLQEVDPDAELVTVAEPDLPVGAVGSLDDGFGSDAAVVASDVTIEQHAARLSASSTLHSTEIEIEYEDLSSTNQKLADTWRQTPDWLKDRLLPLAHGYKAKLADGKKDAS